MQFTDAYFVNELERKEILMNKELWINKIMEEQNVDRDVAETLFEIEICEKYGTEDVVVAEALFNTEENI